MTAGELWIDLKITGGDAVSSQINVTGKALGEVKKMAIETKAAILAAIVAAKNLLMGPIEEGADYAKFERLTGLSAKYLQQVQAGLAEQKTSYANSQALVMSAFDKISNVDVKGTTIQGFAEMTAYLSKIGVTTGNLAETTVPKLIELWRRFATMPGLTDAQKNFVLGQNGFGLNDDQIQGLKGAMRSFESITVPDLITGKEAKALEKASVGLDKIERKTKRLAMDFVTENGKAITDTLQSVLTVMKGLIAVASGLEKSLGVFEKLGVVFGIFNEKVSETANAFERMESIGSKMSKDPKMFEAFKGAKGFAPKVKTSGTGGEQHSSVINQTVNISGNVNDPKEISGSVVKETKVAYRMMSAQLQKV